MPASEVEELIPRHPEYATKPISIWEGHYIAPLFPGDEFDDTERMNHCCDANAGVIGSIVLVARRAIAKGEEVTFDYDTTETSEVGGFECRCGSPLCRGTIDGTAWRRLDFRKQYEGHLSSNVMHRIAKRD